MIARKPAPSGPSRFAAGTRHASKRRWAVSDAHQPILSSCVRVNPGVSRSTSSSEMPLAPRAVGVRAHRDGVEIGPHAGRDERLLAVHHVVRPVAPGRRAQRRDVGASARLGDRERRDLLAGQDRRQHPRLECRRGQGHDRRRGDRVRHQRGQQAARAALRQFDAGDEPVERIRARDAAVFLGIAEAQQADARRARVQLAREAFGLVPGRGMGRQFVGREPAHRFAKGAVFVGVVDGVQAHFRHGRLC